jgi:hypothetical protein
VRLDRLWLSYHNLFFGHHFVGDRVQQNLSKMYGFEMLSFNIKDGFLGMVPFVDLPIYMIISWSELEDVPLIPLQKPSFAGTGQAC